VRRQIKAAQEIWKIMKGERARMRDAEGVEGIDDGQVAIDHRVRFLTQNLLHFEGFRHLSGRESTKHDLVRQQRVHTIDRNKFFRERKGYVLMVLRRTWNSAEHLTTPDAPDKFAEPLAGHTPPIRPHAELERRMSENCRR